MSAILPIFGGLGLFLIGMTVMTDGLRDLAGGALRRSLARFTKTPVSGAATGAVSTALIQSSSATTVIAVGFVSAGLLTFPQALGVILGANIGTTITGWLVALLGFKLSLKSIVLPLIFLGALMRLFGGRRTSAIGFALAGFGLVFAGITMLQDGMESFKDVMTPESFPPNTWFGRFLLVLSGVAITLVTQSSSAGVATAITAVHVGNITFAQAAAIVIGMDVGTTVTAAFATIGRNTDARRTGLAHVVYNLLTGVGAYALLPLYVLGWERLAPMATRSDPEIALVAFHTLFNLVGVVVVLPFTAQFAAWIEWMIVPRGNALTRRLDRSLLSDPDIAMDNIQTTLIELVQVVFPRLAKALDKENGVQESQAIWEEATRAIDESRRYLSQVSTSTTNEALHKRHLKSLHVLDHLDRIIGRCRSHRPLRRARSVEALSEIRRRLVNALSIDVEDPEKTTAMYDQLQNVWTNVDSLVEPHRREVMKRTATGTCSIDEAMSELDAARWLRRVCYHAWRIMHHLHDHAVPDDSDDLDPEPTNDFD